MAGGIAGTYSEMQVWKPSPELMQSVDQYEELSKHGIEMLARHLRELQVGTGNDDQEEDVLGAGSDSDEGALPADSDSIPPGSPYSLASGSVFSWSPRSTSDMKSMDEGISRTPTGEFRPKEHTGPDALRLQLSNCSTKT